MSGIFGLICQSIKKQKALFIILIILSFAMIVLGIFSAINFDGGILSISLDNVIYIKFLKNDCGFIYLIFGSLLSFLLIITIIFLCCSKHFLLPLSIIFYLYFVYSQFVVFTSLILIYGFFNVVILLMLLLIYLLILFFIFMLMLCELTSLNNFNYFKTCFNRSQSCFIYLILFLLISLIIFSIILWILKSFLILLIF